MRSSEKRHRLIEYLNYLTHHEHKSLYPINITINDFTANTNIHLPVSTAYRIVKQYIDTQRMIQQTTLYRHIDDKILQIYND